MKVGQQSLNTLDQFDELHLALYVPFGVLIWIPSKLALLSSPGALMRFHGKSIEICGPRGEINLTASFEHIMQKIEKYFMHVDMFLIDFDHALFKAACDSSTSTGSDMAYHSVPLAQHSESSRGKILQRIACLVDKSRTGHACYETILDADWIRMSEHVEFKSARFMWSKWHKAWKFNFRNIKFGIHRDGERGIFDELQLGLYTPRGLYIYRHDKQLGVSSTGVITATRGFEIVLYGPRSQLDFNKALDTVLAKLDDPCNMCQRLAYIPWLADDDG